MSKDTNRRDFLATHLLQLLQLGKLHLCMVWKQVWDPLPSVLAGGFTTIDLSALKAGRTRSFYIGEGNHSLF